MKKLLSIIMLATLFVACTPEDYDHFATITGTVIDGETGDALGGVLVTLLPGGRNIYTGSDGFFQFNEIDADRYDVQAQKDGYKDWRRNNITPNAGETYHLSINMEKKTK